MKKVYLIGTGTNGTGSLTADAAKAIEDSELIVGATRMLEPYGDSGKELVNEYSQQAMMLIDELKGVKNEEAKACVKEMIRDLINRDH